MTASGAVVLDSSALLAYLRREAGFERVREALSVGAAISSVNWAETLSKLFDLGVDADSVAVQLERGGILGVALRVVDFSEPMAREAARLRPLTRSLGLSLGDRACLALGKALGTQVLTADQSWKRVKGTRVQPIR